MTYNLYFWLYAYLLTMIAIGFALNGYKHIRRGNIAAHRKAMNRAIGLILFFVLSYIFKVILLGREDKSDWSNFYRLVLYVHESFIFLMLVSGTYARVLASRFKHSLTAEVISPIDRERRRRHARLGKIAIFSTCCALITAVAILYGMFQRG